MLYFAVIAGTMFIRECARPAQLDPASLAYTFVFLAIGIRCFNGGCVTITTFGSGNPACITQQLILVY